MSVPLGGLFGSAALYLSQDLWAAKRLLRDGELCVGRLAPDEVGDDILEIAGGVASGNIGLRSNRTTRAQGRVARKGTNILYRVGGAPHQLRFQSTFVELLDPERIYLLALPSDPFRAALIVPEHGLVAPK